MYRFCPNIGVGWEIKWYEFGVSVLFTPATKPPTYTTQAPTHANFELNPTPHQNSESCTLLLFKMHFVHGRYIKCTE